DAVRDHVVLAIGVRIGGAERQYHDGCEREPARGEPAAGEEVTTHHYDAYTLTSGRLPRVQQQVYAPGGASPSCGSGSAAASRAAPWSRSRSLTSSWSRPYRRRTWSTTTAPATITGARSGSRPGCARRAESVREASRSSCASTASRPRR